MTHTHTVHCGWLIRQWSSIPRQQKPSNCYSAAATVFCYFSLCSENCIYRRPRGEARHRSTQRWTWKQKWPKIRLWAKRRSPENKVHFSPWCRGSLFQLTPLREVHSSLWLYELIFTSSFFNHSKGLVKALLKQVSLLLWSFWVPL